jgi:hypothetical protein
MNRYTNAVAVSVIMLLSVSAPAVARSVGFHPRLEMGTMQYEFESEAFSRTIPLFPRNTTLSEYKYEDVMPFVSAGMTIFVNRVFVDVSGQYAFDGNDSDQLTRSTYTITRFDPETNFLSSEYYADSRRNDTSFDRRDFAVSLGYALSGSLSIFAGYKQVATQFTEKTDGMYSYTVWDGDNSAENIDYTYGRLWGVGRFKFEYSGPFIGFIKGWTFDDTYFLKGIITANVALAFLEGKLTTRHDVSHMSVLWAGDQQIPEYIYPGTTPPIISRSDTKGDALGLKVNLSWRGNTPWEGLSYIFGISGYRYEFDTSGTESNMNETAIHFKAGLSYDF